MVVVHQNSEVVVPTQQDSTSIVLLPPKNTKLLYIILRKLVNCLYPHTKTSKLIIQKSDFAVRVKTDVVVQIEY